MDNNSDIKALFDKIHLNPAFYQELTSLRKSDVHVSRWTLLRDIHNEYQNSAKNAHLLTPQAIKTP